MELQGRCFKYGDNINTDEIIPARYLNTTDPAELSAHCLEDLDVTFKDRVKPGDFLVAGKNFGCGSSREHAPIALKGCGVGLVMAESFARIFYRNAINTGLLIVECPEACRQARDGDLMSYDVTTGLVRNITREREYKTIPFPGFIRELIDKGGLLPWLMEQVEGGAGTTV